MAITTSATTLTFNNGSTQTVAPVNTNANVVSATAVAGTGISVTAITTTGTATHTITNTGVTSVVAGTGISVSGATGAVTVSATGGVTSLNGQTGDITNTTYGAIGSYILGRAANATNYPINSTLAGSSLFQTCANAVWEGGDFVLIGIGTPTTAFSAVGSGTWRCVSGAVSTSDGWGTTGLWVRIS
jgi:hypothetical protein